MSIALFNAAGLVAPAGNYSHVAIAGGLIFISGQLPLLADGRPLTTASFDDQARLTLNNLEACLVAAGVTKRHLVQVRVHLVRIGDWQAFDAIYTEWIGTHRPARAVIGCAALHYGVALEVEAVAAATIAGRDGQ